jgi:hypothetical protein
MIMQKNTHPAQCSTNQLHSYYVHRVIGSVVSVHKPAVFKQEQCYGAEGLH